VDPSKETGTTLPASSFNANNTSDVDKQAIIVRLSRKLGIKALAFKWAPK
jgi:hypothetical protein